MKVKNIVLLILGLFIIAAFTTGAYSYMNQGLKANKTQSESAAVTTRADAYVKQGLKASKTQSKSAALTTGADSYVNQGFKAYKAHNYSSALLLYDKALKLEPKNAQALNGKGVVLAFSGKPKEGLKYINRAIVVKPKYLTAYFNAGLANELAHDYPAAIKAYKAVIASDPKNTWSYYGIACAYAQMGDALHATQYLTKAIALDNNVKMDARTEKDFDRIRKDKGFIKVIK